MGGSRRDVAAVVVALAAAAVVLAVSELPRCHGADKPTYECSDVTKQNMVCNVELKVNESLKIDCTKAYERAMPWKAFFKEDKEICVPEKPYQYFKQACEKIHVWRELNKDGIVEVTQTFVYPRVFIMTLKNKNKHPPVDLPMISFGCASIDFSRSAVFNVSFSKAISHLRHGEAIVPWTSGSWGLMNAPQPLLVFASAMMTIAFALGLSV